MTEWDRALCIGRGSLFLFDSPEYDESRAKAVCGVCCLRNDCSVWATTFPEPFDIWGGETPEERGLRTPVMIRGRGPVTHGTESGYAWHRRHRVVMCDDCREAGREANARRHRRRRGAGAAGTE